MRKYLFVLIVFILSLTHPFGAKVLAQDKKCSDCHSTILSGKMAHSPVKQGCDACHKSNGQAHPQTDVKGFALAKEMPDLCYTCHTPLNTKSKVHGVVKNGKCMLCHTPHSSDNPKLLKDYPAGKLCLECHDDLGIDEFKGKHSSVANGNCTGCHDPHQSEDPKLLRLTGQELCFSCHNQVKAGLSQKSVHPPAVNKCTICHKPHGSAEDHMLTQKVSDLCFGCHDDLQADFDQAKFPHKALKEEKSCINCHSPHSSPNDSLLKSANIGTLCLNCHKLDIANKKTVHGAVTKGQCQACHDPHKSENKGLIRELTTDLCTKCHTKQKDQLAMAVVHPPFKNKCGICHAPHATDELSLLKNNVKDLCVGCHDDFEEPLQTAKVVHGPLKDAKSCTNCHSPHASANAKVLLADQKSLCLSCHNKGIKTGDRMLVNMKQLLQKNKFVHGAIEKNGCVGCHNPHYSENVNMLAGKIQKDFYINGIKDSLTLCFTCHDSKLLEDQSTTTATSFRNGDKNLHFVHVNGKKGRNCFVCHEVHAASNKHLLKEKIQFGDWNMNLAYTEADGGGACLTACHGSKTYKR